MKHEFVLEGLHCANCAAKIEAKLEKRYGDVRFSFATLELEIHTDEKDIRDEVQQIVDAIEDGVTVVPKAENTHTEYQEKNSHDCHDRLSVWRFRLRGQHRRTRQGGDPPRRHPRQLH